MPFSGGPSGFTGSSSRGAEFVDELLRREVHEAVELPPGRLVLAAVPAEQLSQQPAGVLLDRPFGTLARDVAGEPVCERLDTGLGLGQLLRRLAVARCRSRDLEPGCHCEARRGRLQPVAQAGVADDVVLVVALDPLEVVGSRPLALAELEPLFERDDARPGVAQVDVAFEP